MAISVYCPCGKSLKAKDSHAGKRAPCPKCGRLVPIPPPLPAVVPAKAVSTDEPPANDAAQGDSATGTKRRVFHPYLCVYMGACGIRYYRLEGLTEASQAASLFVGPDGDKAITEVSADEPFREIARKYHLVEWSAVVSAIAILFLFAGLVLFVTGQPRTTACLVAAVGCAGFVSLPWVAWRDRVVRTTRVFYFTDGLGQRIRDSVAQLFEVLQQTNAVWAVFSQVHHGDWKRNAGAVLSVERRRVRAGFSAPPNVVTNVKVGYLATPSRQLYFFPDRVVLYGNGEVETIAYDALQVDYQPIHFIESESVPPDARVIKHTWQYVNKDGGPDRRFNNNRQLPVVLYGELTVVGGSGLRLLLKTSNCEAAKAADKTFAAMRNALHALRSVRRGSFSPSPPLDPECALERPPLAGTAQVIAYSLSFRWVSRLPDWAQPIVWGIVSALPIVVLLILFFQILNR